MAMDTCGSELMLGFFSGFMLGLMFGMLASQLEFKLGLDNLKDEIGRLTKERERIKAEIEQLKAQGKNE